MNILSVPTHMTNVLIVTRFQQKLFAKRPKCKFVFIEMRHYQQSFLKVKQGVNCDQ